MDAGKINRSDPLANVELPQSEADQLLELEKVCRDDTIWEFPNMGGFVSIPLTSRDGRVPFLLDIQRGRVNSARITYQNRVRKSIVLVRLDLGGSPHRNPDGQRIETPHLHLYRAGYADKWAFPVPMDRFRNLSSMRRSLDDFMRYCNIVDAPDIVDSPYIQGSLFA